MEEYLRLPTPVDLKATIDLHKRVHGVDGMMGSIDCTHTYWKNCPIGWQGSFKNGKNKLPSIVLEAACDYNLFFWHVAYGYAGVMGDVTIFHQSPMFDRMLDGTLEDVERNAGVVPFQIQNESFDATFLLADGAYPRYSRFVKGIKQPISNRDRDYTAWQEAARKDIERAFGMLKGTWQYTARPILTMNLDRLALRITCCLVLHNMLVSDRVMGDVRAVYKADEVYQCNVLHQLEDPGTDTDEVGAPTDEDPGTDTLSAFLPVTAVPTRYEVNENRLVKPNHVTQLDRFEELSTVEEHTRLHAALMSRFD
jgi:Plant transposon protein